jgi:hypothetical protein
MATKGKPHKHSIRHRSSLPNGVNVCVCGATKRHLDKEWHVCSLCVPNDIMKKEKG